MAEKQDNPIWSLVVWGSAAVVMLVVAVWCIVDGWFRPGYEHADFSRWGTPFASAAAIWCVWKGVKEYKQVKSSPQGQGPASRPEGQGDDGGTSGAG